MNVIDWLLSGDASIARLTKKYLLEEEVLYTNVGWITQYLSFYNHEHKQWANGLNKTEGPFGHGIYSPKWISTFYTLRELTLLEINPEDPIYQEGMKTLLHFFWNKDLYQVKDICVVGMLLSMVIYAQCDQQYITEMVDYLIYNQVFDGGFNCESRSHQVHSSSIHTTLSVLEGFEALIQSDYIFDKQVIFKIKKEAEAFLLRKRLMRRESNNEIIQSYIVHFHYPTRWKYDVLKALIYFANSNHPYDTRFDEAMSLLKKRIMKGKLPKGPFHSGLLFFPLDSENVARMNSLRGLIVLKKYDFAFYQSLLSKS
ncbi:MAG: hypothetical protein AB7U79_04340 [Candidatus Izemoplasmatales bacterium]